MWCLAAPIVAGHGPGVALCTAWLMTTSGTPSAARPAKIGMDEDLTMLIGPARDGTPLEIGVLDIGDDPVVIHAMRLRPKFYPFIS
jgi:hypothetical protein